MSEVKLVAIDVKSHEECKNTLAMLKILVFGEREIEEGKFKDAEVVFAQIK